MKFLAGLVVGIIVRHIGFDAIHKSVPKPYKTKVTTALYKFADRIEENK